LLDGADKKLEGEDLSLKSQRDGSKKNLEKECYEDGKLGFSCGGKIVEGG